MLWRIPLAAALTLCFFLFGSNPVQAQQTDPDGLALAYKLVTSQSPTQFQLLFVADPPMSKRAFLASMEYVEFTSRMNPASSRISLNLSQTLAKQIELQFQDPRPSQIFSLYVSGHPTSGQSFLEYATSLYPAYTKAPDVASHVTMNAIPYDQQKSLVAFLAHRRYLVKIARVLIAAAFSDLELTLQELQTHDQAHKVYLDALQAAQLDTLEALEELRGYAAAGEVGKLMVLTELGLLDEFDAKRDDILSHDSLRNYSPIAFIIAYRVAYRQGEYQRAKGYLELSKASISGSITERDPIYQYILETAKTQLELAAGAEFTDAELLQRFESAWSKLQDFQPTTMPEISGTWLQGRHFNEFWFRELERHKSIAKSATNLISRDFQKWRAEVSTDSYVQAVQEDGPRLFMKVQGSAILIFTLVEHSARLLEIQSEEFGRDDVQEFANLVPKMVSSIQSEAFDIGGPNFPPFQLAKGPYPIQLNLQSDYLYAIASDTSPDSERKHLLELLDHSRSKLNPDFSIRLLRKVGSRFGEMGDRKSAIKAWQSAFDLADRFKFTRLSTELATLLAKEHAELENWREVARFASIANRASQTNLGTESDASQADEISELTIEAHIRTENPQKALEAISQGHQRGTAAVQLAADPEAAKANQALQHQREQLDVLDQKISSLQSLPQTGIRDELIGKTQGLLAETRADFLLQSRNIRREHSKLYTTGLRFDPLNLPDIQSSLEKSTAVVQYFATEEQLYIFVVTPSAFRLRTVPKPKTELYGLVTDYLRRLNSVQKNDPALKTLSRKLHAILIEPVYQDLEDSSTLVLIPSGSLNILPFSALLDSNGTPLLEQKTILELAKTTDFMKIAQTPRKPVQSVVAFANATLDLPSAEEEGQSILSIFPKSKIFARGEASKANLLKFGNLGEVLHLATHGTWDAKDSLNNHLKLSNNERLDQEDIFKLDLSTTSIVTLSACSTALGDNSDAEYVASLAEAFWIAGSRSVVASLWPVDDGATGELMTHFYENLKSGNSKAVALQKAQLEVRTNPRFSHPYFWSGFLLFGDYR